MTDIRIEPTIHIARPVTTLSQLCHCGHDVGTHDAIAGRYCRATKAADMSRGCACGPVPARREVR